MKRQSKAEELLDSTWLPALIMAAVAAIVFYFFRRRQPDSLDQGTDEPVVYRRDIEMGPVRAQGKAAAVKEEPRSRTSESPAAEVVGPVDSEDLPETETPGGDDLEIIEGIGPKIDSILQEAGIRTFRKLAETDVERLRQILRDAGLRTALSNPETWSEQAQLAADGQWSKLETMQSQLKAGRRG